MTSLAHLFWPLNPLGIALYLLAINALALGLYAWDKHRARSGGWRVKERSLLLVGLLGGSPASLFAQIYLRHKTRKQPFQGLFRVILVLQALGLILFAVIHWL